MRRNRIPTRTHWHIADFAKALQCKVGGCVHEKHRRNGSAALCDGHVHSTYTKAPPCVLRGVQRHQGLGLPPAHVTLLNLTQHFHRSHLSTRCEFRVVVGLCSRKPCLHGTGLGSHQKSSSFKSTIFSPFPESRPDSGSAGGPAPICGLNGRLMQDEAVIQSHTLHRF